MGTRAKTKVRIPAAYFLLPIGLILLQCTSSTQKEGGRPLDTLTINSESPTASTPTIQPTREETNDGSIDIDNLTKYPFESDHAALKNDLIETGFTVRDTIILSRVVLLFDSSRVEINDADDGQDVIGDLICSADIRSARFPFGQGVAIGMEQNEFLTRSNLSKSSLQEDLATGNSYYEHEIPFDDGHWKITFWFHREVLTRIQYEISPCEIEYDH